jgi:hypothetical protein
MNPTGALPPAPWRRRLMFEFLLRGLKSVVTRFRTPFVDIVFSRILGMLVVVLLPPSKFKSETVFTGSAVRLERKRMMQLTRAAINSSAAAGPGWMGKSRPCGAKVDVDGHGLF